MRTRMSSKNGLMVLGFLVSWTLPAVAQEFKGPIWGGSGGTSSYDLDCGTSGVMVGIYGKAGNWVDQIGITCQKVNADGTLGSTYTRGPKGGSGGSGATSRCDSGMVVGAMSSFSGSFMDQVHPWCWPWSSSTRRPNFSSAIRAPVSYAVGTMGIAGALSFTIRLNDMVYCPNEKVGKALRGRYGGYIDSLQFVCDDYNK
jgi:hypothetical protein